MAGGVIKNQNTTSVVCCWCWKHSQMWSHLDSRSSSVTLLCVAADLNYALWNVCFFFLNPNDDSLSKMCCVTLSSTHPPAPTLPVHAKQNHCLVTTGDVRIHRHGNSAEKFGVQTPFVTTSFQMLGTAFRGCITLVHCTALHLCVCSCQWVPGRVWY